MSVDRVVDSSNWLCSYGILVSIVPYILLDFSEMNWQWFPTSHFIPLQTVHVYASVYQLMNKVKLCGSEYGCWRIIHH